MTSALKWFHDRQTVAIILWLNALNLKSNFFLSFFFNLYLTNGALVEHITSRTYKKNVV